MCQDTVAEKPGRPENSDEEQALRWLEGLGRSVKRLRHDPPDFVVDGKYGVEVTRLHTQEDDHDGRRRKQALRRTMEGLFQEVSPRRWHPSYSVRVSYDMTKKLPNELAAKDGEYEELWLVLVDHIGHAPMDSHEADEVRSQILVEAPWNLVVILSTTQPPFPTELRRD